MIGGKRDHWPLFMVCALLAVNGLFLYFNAFRQLAIFDMGAYLSGGWHLSIGYKPYSDFLLNLPPFHLHMNAFFFQIFGFGKTAILAHMISVSSVVILAVFGVLRRHLPKKYLLIVLCLTMTGFYWPVSHPWYNQSAQLWGLLAVAYLMSRLPLNEYYDAWVSGMLVGFFMVLSFMSKPNIGAAYCIVFFVTFCFSRRRVQLFAGSIVAGIATLGMMRLFFIPSYTLFIEQAFPYVVMRQDRMGRVILESELWFSNYYWVIAALVFLGLRGRPLSRIWNENKELFCLFFGLWFVGILSRFTSSAHYVVAIQTMGLYVGIGLRLLFLQEHVSAAGSLRSSAKWPHRLLMAVMLLLTVTYTKMSVDLNIWKWSPLYNDSKKFTLKTGPLKGWECHADQCLALDGLHDLIKRTVPAGDPIFVMTDLQLLNPISGHPQPKGLPWALQTDELPAPGKQLKDFQERMRHDPPQWIVTHKDFRRVELNTARILGYLNVGDVLNAKYRVAGDFGNYVLLMRR